MRKRLLAMLVILLFMGSSFTISNEAGEGRIKNEKVIAKITCKSNESIAPTLQPIVIITSPEDGSVVTDPHLVVLGHATDEAGMNYWEWEWRYKGGSHSNSSYFETAEYIEFRIDIYGLHPGWNLIIVRFKNIYGAIGEDSVNVTYNPSNNPPNKPSKPEGPTEGKVKETLYFNTVTTDPDGDSLEYLVDWGDGTNTGWLGPITSGTPFQTFHSWDEPGTYEVKAKARDIPYLEESEWSEPLIVTIYGEGTTPPMVTITSPPDNYVTNNSDITIEGYINDNKGVTYFGFTWEKPDGTAISSWDPITPVTHYDFSLPVTLDIVGRHKFTLSCEDTDGNYASASVNVTYVPPQKNLIIQPKDAVYMFGALTAEIDLPQAELRGEWEEKIEAESAIVIGWITVKVDVSMVPGTDYIDFFVNTLDNLKFGPIVRYTDYTPPYEWEWYDLPWIYVLGVAAKDVNGQPLAVDYVLVIFI